MPWKPGATIALPSSATGVMAPAYSDSFALATTSYIDSEIGGAWLDYAQWCILTNITLGTTSSVSARFKKIGRIVFFQVAVVIGNGSVGGTISVSLPFPVANNISFGGAGNNFTEGAVLAFISPNFFSGTPNLTAGSTAFNIAGPNTAGAWNATVPGTWAAGSYFEASGMYETTSQQLMYDSTAPKTFPQDAKVRVAYQHGNIVDATTTASGVGNTAGSTSLTVTSAAGMVIGDFVGETQSPANRGNLAQGTTITNIAGNVLTISPAIVSTITAGDSIVAFSGVAFNSAQNPLQTFFGAGGVNVVNASTVPNGPGRLQLLMDSSFIVSNANTGTSNVLDATADIVDCEANSVTINQAVNWVTAWKALAATGFVHNVPRPVVFISNPGPAGWTYAALQTAMTTAGFTQGLDWDAWTSPASPSPPALSTATVATTTSATALNASGNSKLYVTSTASVTKGMTVADTTHPRFILPGTVVGTIGSDGNGPFVTLINMTGGNAFIQYLPNGAGAGDATFNALPAADTITFSNTACATQFAGGGKGNVGFGNCDVSITQAGWPQAMG